MHTVYHTINVCHRLYVVKTGHGKLAPIVTIIASVHTTTGNIAPAVHNNFLSTVFVSVESNTFEHEINLHKIYRKVDNIFKKFHFHKDIHFRGYMTVFPILH
jgi:hypothetical protein